MFPHSIRGRLLLYLGFWLGCILVGFAVTAYQLTRMNQLGVLDEALDRRVAAVQLDFRRARLPFGMGFMAHSMPLPDPRTMPDPHAQPDSHGMPLPPAMPEAGAPPNDPNPDEVPEPNSTPGFSRRSNGMREERERRFFNRDPEREQADFKLSADTAALFPPQSPGSYFYATWSSRGDPLGHSANVPKDLTKPPADTGGRTLRRTSGVYRESYYFTERGECVLVGASMADDLQAAERTARWLGAAGALVLLIGLGGGALIVGRALRPIRRIASAAERVASGNLGERIAVEDPRSELDGLAQVLNATFARLEAAFAEQRQFTADASHELRTPLSVLMVEVQTSLRRERTEASYRETLGNVLEITQEMRRLIESLLELARWDAGQETVRAEPVDLAEIARAESERLQGLADQKQVRLELQLTPMPILGDARRLERVVSNLVQNAVSYNHAGGIVRVTVDKQAAAAVLTVRDTGMGIDPKDLPHIFERFYRSDRARTGGDSHSGLGLSIVKTIVEAHGGSIAVESAVGQGATFSVRLPAQQ